MVLALQVSKNWALLLKEIKKKTGFAKPETPGAWTVYSFQKFQNAVFFRDISNSFESVTQTGLKPHQKIFFEKSLKTDAASPIFRFF